MTTGSVPVEAGGGIDATTRVASVTLRVRDLATVAGFYESAIGLWPLSRGAGEAWLGAGETPLLHLIEDRGAPPRAPDAPGLYHTAFVVPSRAELSRSLRRMALARVPMTGFADHLVSEALYLDDPEGNGIEVYRDRPREEWPHDAEGHLRMATDPIDLEGVLAEADGPPPERVGAATGIGHIHLRVADVAAAESYYRERVGLDVMLRFAASASFLAAGGYHHQVGLNSWHSAGAAPAAEGALGLDGFVLAGTGREMEEADPSGNRVRSDV